MISKLFHYINPYTHLLRFRYHLYFLDRDGTKKVVQFIQGQHILEVAKNNDIDLEGACQASLACSTCHIILPVQMYQILDKPKDQEQDLLDLAFGLTQTSRLGCQVILKEQHHGFTVKIPRASRNMYVDGTKPIKH